MFEAVVEPRVEGRINNTMQVEAQQDVLVKSVWRPGVFYAVVDFMI